MRLKQGRASRFRREPVNVRLDPHMRRGFNLQVSPSFVGVEVAGQRALNIARPGNMPLDEVGVVGVHHPNQGCELLCGARV